MPVQRPSGGLPEVPPDVPAEYAEAYLAGFRRAQALQGPGEPGDTVSWADEDAETIAVESAGTDEPDSPDFLADPDDPDSLADPDDPDLDAEPEPREKRSGPWAFEPPKEVEEVEDNPPPPDWSFEPPEEPGPAPEPEWAFEEPEEPPYGWEFEQSAEPPLSWAFEPQDEDADADADADADEDPEGPPALLPGLRAYDDRDPSRVRWVGPALLTLLVVALIVGAYLLGKMLSGSA